jgi:hypothetical protein
VSVVRYVKLSSYDVFYSWAVVNSFTCYVLRGHRLIVLCEGECNFSQRTKNF